MLSQPVPDDELVAAWRRGQESAAAELMNRHAEPVARFLAAAGALDDVEDLVQEAFYKAFSKIDSFDGRSSFRTWVMRIGSQARREESSQYSLGSS